LAFNGNGTFLRVMNWTNDALSGIKIRADRHDAEDDNLAQGLSQCITKDGQTTITANLPMANYRHTGVGEATAATQYARYDQVLLGKTVWAVAGGSADALTATYAIPTAAPVDGQLYYVRATAANATTTPTFAPDGNTARTIVKNGDVALATGDIAGAGHELILRYRLADTKYELLNPKNNPVGTTNGILKANGSGVITAAVEGTDYYAPGGTDVAVADGGTNISSYTTGDTLYASAGTTLTKLAIGGAGRPLVSTGSAPSWGNAIVLQAAVATTSGTTVDISTSIPAGVRKISGTINGVSVNGTGVIGLVLGDAGGYEFTGYAGGVTNHTTGVLTDALSTSFAFNVSAASTAAAVYHGRFEAQLHEASTNTWSFSMFLGRSDAAATIQCVGTKSLSATLDRIGLTSSSTFDAGSVSIAWEF
jgi:hypothetical protein